MYTGLTNSYPSGGENSGLNEQHMDTVMGEPIVPGGKSIVNPSFLHLIVFPVMSTFSEWTRVEHIFERDSGQEWWHAQKSVKICIKKRMHENTIIIFDHNYKQVNKNGFNLLTL